MAHAQLTAARAATIFPRNAGLSYPETVEGNVETRSLISCQRRSLQALGVTGARIGAMGN